MTQQGLTAQLEAAFEASQEAIIDAMPGGVVVVAASGAIVQANDAATSFLGVPWEALSTLCVEDFGSMTVHEDGSPCPVDDYPVTRCLRTGKPQPSLIHGVRRPDGGVSWAVFRATPLHDPQGELVGAVITFLDITARRAAEEQLRQSEQQLRELLQQQRLAEAAKLELEARLAASRRLESLGVLAGGVAHDFSNLLVGILGGLDLVERTLPDGCAPRQHLQDLRAAAEQAAELTDQLLAYSGRGAFVRRELDLNHVIHESRRLLERPVPPTVELRYELADGLPGLIGDATQLRQVLVNLVTNAVDVVGATGGGTVTIGTSLLNSGSGELVLEVSDDGPGIGPDALPLIFDPFFSTKETGRGLGLAAAQGIVRGHGGTLKLARTGPEGTMFRARFPTLDHEVAPGPSARAPLPPAQHPDRSGHLILVVDDEVHVRRVLSLVLADEGYEVLTAPDGVRALEIFRARADEVALVVLDLLMPGMDGEEVLAELRRERPQLPVVLVSGYAEDLATRNLGDAGLAGFVKKPFHLEELVRLVDDVALARLASDN